MAVTKFSVIPPPFSFLKFPARYYIIIYYDSIYYDIEPNTSKIFAAIPDKRRAPGTDLTIEHIVYNIVSALPVQKFKQKALKIICK
jgi:hypothetical protein